MMKNLIERLLPIFASMTWAFLFGIMIILFTEGLFDPVPEEGNDQGWNIPGYHQYRLPGIGFGEK